MADTTTIGDMVLTDKDFKNISDIVYKHCGINLHEGKKGLVRSRLTKRLRVYGFETFPEYMKYINDDESGKEFSIFIDSLSTNLTSFFRESQHFDFLSEKFLPSLMERKEKKRNFRIRAWSAGCSSGEEPYSIAITLLEAIKGQACWDAKILATDISTRILESAKKGIYNEERVRPVSPMQKNKYLLKTRDRKEKLYEVGDSLRKMINFQYLNLMEGWPVKGPIDFIFCRNVMIYFDKSTQCRLVNRYWELLDSGGLLFTGHSESLTGIDHKFDYIQPTIYMKR